ncbi:MAG: hypothetical protein FJZ43_03700, partial [Candidatus Staskawiczbacteria bacterium]|nr:hypothetical protein [Candidatus Staskawiczbacteria bacterium]
MYILEILNIKKIKKNIMVFSSFCLASLIVFSFIFSGGLKYITAATGAPKIIVQQGRLLNGSGDLLGSSSGTNYCFRFSIYDASSGGSKLWPSGTPSIMTISVVSGIFNAPIGDTSAGGDTLDLDFQTTDTLYLNVDVASSSGGSCSGVSSFETLTPRQRIVSSGYAINSNTVGGFTPAQSASGSQIPALTSGNLVLGGTNPQINVSSTNTLTFQGGAGTGNIQFFSSSNNITSGGALTIAGAFVAGGAISGSNLSGTNTGDQTTVSGNAGTVTFSDAGGDTTTFVALGTAATGSLSPATDAGLTYNATTNALTATTFVGALTGDVTGNVSGTAATVTGAAQSAITSLGTLTSLDVDNINVNGNTIISSNTNGNITLTPNGTGNIALGTLTINADQTVGAGQDNYVLTYDDATGLINLETTAISGANTALSNLSSVAINAALVLGTSDAFALGSATKMWSDLFLASGGVVNWNNGAHTIFEDTGNDDLTVTGGGLRLSTAASYLTLES